VFKNHPIRRPAKMIPRGLWPSVARLRIHRCPGSPPKDLNRRLTLVANPITAENLTSIDKRRTRPPWYQRLQLAPGLFKGMLIRDCREAETLLKVSKEFFEKEKSSWHTQEATQSETTKTVVAERIDNQISFHRERCVAGPVWFTFTNRNIADNQNVS
jgi:hypothetical protein